LAAARGAGGSLGPRAAWLLVDLLAVAGPARRGALDRALDAARSAQGRAKAAATLERIASHDLDGASWHALLERIRAGDLEAAGELARMAARSGFAHALEHPDVAMRDASHE